jgi:hypothetical protein
MVLLILIRWRFLMTFNTNADSKVSKAEEAEQDTIDRYDEYANRKIAETPTEGQGYKPIEFIEGKENVVTRDIMRDERKEEFAPVIPAGWEYDIDGRVIWKLSPYHFHMVKEGRVCHACLEWQSDVQSFHCLWRGKSEGCGAERYAAGMNDTDVFGRK